VSQQQTRAKSNSEKNKVFLQKAKKRERKRSQKKQKKQEKKSRQKSSGYFFVLFLSICGQNGSSLRKNSFIIIFIIYLIELIKEEDKETEEIKKRDTRKKW